MLGTMYVGDDMLPGAAGDSGAGCCICGVVVDGLVIGSVLCAAGAAGSAVCADTKPTVPTIVAAAIAAIRVLDAFIVDLLETLIKGKKPFAETS